MGKLAESTSIRPHYVCSAPARKRTNALDTSLLSHLWLARPLFFFALEQITRQYFFRVRAVSSVFCPHLRTSKPANLRNWKTASLLFHMKLQSSCGTKYVMMLDATNDNRTRLNQSHTCISYPLMTRLFISERYDNYLSRIYYLFFLSQTYFDAICHIRARIHRVFLTTW